MMIAPNSRAREGGKEKGSMEHSEERRRRGMLTTGEWCNLVWNISG